MLLASGDGATRRLFVAASYFRSMVGAGSMELLDRYLDLHGPGRRRSVDGRILL